MRLSLPKSLLWPLLALGALLPSFFLVSCDKDLTSTEDQPTVDYVLIITDSATSAPLQDVKIRVTTISGDTSTYFTDRAEGRAELATVASSRTLFVLSKSGFRTLDLLDTVNSKPDTLFNRPVQRLLRVKMANLDGETGRVQARVLLRDENLGKILGGTVTLTDSLGEDIVFADHDSDGTVLLTGLKAGKNALKVEHPSHLGRRTEVTHEKSADTGSAQVVTVRLMAMNQEISGQVYYKTATASQPLLDARVEFHLKDSSAVPEKFIAYTSAEAAKNGLFRFTKVPAQDGELWFFKNRASGERSKMVPITKEEVLLDGPIPLVTITVTADSLLPLLASGPKAAGLPGRDSVDSKDSLVFKFNQPVAEVKTLKVSLINGSELLIQKAWSKDNTLLKVWQKDAGWIEGKKYAYEIAAVNAQGDAFGVPGDSSRSIQGGFDVRSTGGKDTTVAYPRDIRMAYFNSGNHFLFGAADTNTSPKADSSSEFVRLKWKWDTAAKRVDSLVIYFQDNRKNTSWSRWGALPGFLDSAYLAFSDKYGTMQAPGDKDRFPLRDSGGAISFRIIPKHEGKDVDAEDTTLEAVTQGMGPTVYAFYETAVDSGVSSARDTVTVKFRRSRTDTAAFNWGASPPVPKLFDDNNVASGLEWAWDADGKQGYLTYILPGVVTRPAELRVDLNGVSYRGKPVWQRNARERKVVQ